MRSERSAIWTSGEPVSLSCWRCFWMVSCLRTVETDMISSVAGGRVGEGERAGAGAAQAGQVRAGAERAAEVRDQGAHVGALRALDREAEARRVPGEQLEAMDRHRARRAIDVLTFAGQLVQRAAGA